MLEFDIERYRTVKADVITQIKATHRWQEDEGFIADGVIHPQLFKQQTLKVLFLLGECYGFSRSGVVDIEQQPEDDIFGVGYHRRKTSKKVDMLLWLLHQAIMAGREMTDDDLPYLLQDRPEYVDQIRDAVLNNGSKASLPFANADHS